MMKPCLALMLAVLLTASPLTMAGKGDRGRPEMVKALDGIDFATRTIRLGGRSYRLADDVRWVGLEPGRSPRDVMPRRIGERMGIWLDYKGDQAVVSEVWIQP